MNNGMFQVNPDLFQTIYLVERVAKFEKSRISAKEHTPK